MRAHYKLILIALIAYNAFTVTFANNYIKHQKDSELLNKHLKTQDNYLKIKTSINESNKNVKDEISRNIVEQLYNRFEETTEYNNITSISKQPVDAIKREIGNLNDSNLKKNNINGLSNALLEFIAKGSLTYGEITPNAALEELSTRNIKLSNDNIQQSRQHDIAEIEARETIQDIQKFYDNIKGMEKNNIDPSIMDDISEIELIGKELEKSKDDNTVKNALIDIFMNKDNNTNVKLPDKLTKEEITELKQILKDRKILPKEHGVVITKLKQFGTRIKNLFKKSDKKSKEEENKTEVNKEEKNKSEKDSDLKSKNSEEKISSSKEDTDNKSDITVSNNISQDEIADIMIANSNLFE